MPSISLPSASTIALGSLALGAAGTGVSTIGALEAGQAAQKQAAYQAEVAKNNAIIANQNAESALQAGNAKEAAQSLQGRATVGKAVADAAASGVDVSSGSAADVVQTDRELNKLDVLTTANNAEQAAYGYRVAATSDTAQGQLDTAQAAQAAAAGPLSAGGDLLSGASSVGSKWAAYQFQAGGNPSTAPAVPGSTLPFG